DATAQPTMPAPTTTMSDGREPIFFQLNSALEEGYTARLHPVPRRRRSYECRVRVRAYGSVAREMPRTSAQIRSGKSLLPGGLRRPESGRLPADGRAARVRRPRHVTRAGRSRNAAARAIRPGDRAVHQHAQLLGGPDGRLVALGRQVARVDPARSRRR